MPKKARSALKHSLKGIIPEAIESLIGKRDVVYLIQKLVDWKSKVE